MLQECSNEPLFRRRDHFVLYEGRTVDFMEKKSHSFSRFVAPVVVLLLLVASSILIFQIRTEEYKDWTAVPGVVFKREWVRNFRVRIYYTYTVDGESYTGSELYHRSNGTAEAGDETLIWYDPENPAHSSYHKPGPGLDPYGVYFLMAPLAVAWLAENRRKS